MSDFPARAFKWTEMLSLILENGFKENSKLREQLRQLREYATQKYKANPQIEERYLEYTKGSFPEETFLVLMKMFGEP